jgi:integrase
VKAYIRKVTSNKTGHVSWRLVIYASKQEGGPKSYSAGNYPLKKDAEQAVEGEMARVRLLTSSSAPDMLVTEIVERCVRDHWATAVRPKTLERYRDLERLHIAPHFGGRIAAEVRPIEIAEWQTRLAKTLSPATVIQVRAVLHKAYSWACVMGLQAANPVSVVRRPTLVQQKITLPRNADILKAIEAAKNTQLFVPLVIAAGTGMRRGEVLALRWRDIDLGAGKAEVIRSLSSVGKSLVISAPKTAKGNRVVALPMFVIEALKEERNAAETRARVLSREFSEDDLVCANLDGSPLDPDQISHNFYHLLKRNDLPHMRFHDLRHAVASAMLENGVRVDAVQHHLGHANPAVTLGIYGHLMNDVQHEAIAVWGDDLMAADATSFNRALAARAEFGGKAGEVPVEMYAGAGI